jgi:hypothetical protein
MHLVAAVSLTGTKLTGQQLRHLLPIGIVGLISWSMIGHGARLAVRRR